MKRGRLATSTAWDNESIFSVGDFLNGLDGAIAHPEVEAHAARLRESLQAQFEQKSAFLDGAIVLNSGSPVSVHRCILAACSPVLAELLSLSVRVTLPPNLVVDDVAWEVLIPYCYSGMIPDIAAENQLAVLRAALTLQMGSAVASLLDQIRNSFQIDSIVTHLVQAEAMQCIELVTSCLAFIDDKFRSVVLEQGFIDAPAHLVKTILQRDTLNVRAEIEVFRALSRWAHEDEPRRRDDFLAMLADERIVRVGWCSSDELVDVEAACAALPANKRTPVDEAIARRRRGEPAAVSPRTGPVHASGALGTGSPLLAPGRPRLESIVGARDHVMFPPVQKLVGHTKGVVALAAVDDECIISGGADGVICVWAIARMSLVRTVACHADAVVALKVLPSNGDVVSGSLDRSLKVHRPSADWKMVAEIKDAHGEAPVCCMALVRKGSLLATGSAQGEIKVWSVESWTCVCAVPHGHSHVVWAMCEWDGRLVSASSDTTIKLWALGEGGAPLRLEHTITGHQDEVQALAVVGNRLVSGADDGVIMVHNASDFSLHESVPLGRPVLTIADASEDIVAAGLGDGTIVLLKKGKALVPHAELKGHESSVMALLSWKRKGIVSGSYDMSVRAWGVF